MSKLGQLIKEDPRTVWTREDRDFTPWLAGHLDELGDVLGMDLELVGRESSAGDFSIDILARDLGRDEFVVIENQLEQTDHSHLGQSITYAAAVDAGVVVWVCREFREEHRAALDWLNRGLGSTTEFFGVELQVLRIDDSKPAAYFRVVAAPSNKSVRRTSPSGDRAPTEKGLRYQEFFQRLLDELREQHRFTKARAGQPQNWYTFSSGVPGFSYGASFARGGRLRVELYIDRGESDENFTAFLELRAEEAAIETVLGELEWEQLESRRSCRIALYKDGAIEDPQDELDAHHEWLVKTLLAFREVFAPRISELVQRAV